MKISFCTQIHNRWWQLEQVLAANLAALEGTEHEWVVLDYASDDGLDLPEHPNLRYVRTDAEYAMATAKRAVRQLGTGDYLYSLDADNYITAETLARITAAPELGLAEHAAAISGTGGRIGAPATAWAAIEYGVGWNNPFYEDRETVRRLETVVDVQHLAYAGPAPVANTARQTLAYLPADQQRMDAANFTAANTYPYMPRLTVELPAGAVRVGLRRERRHDVMLFAGELNYTVQFSDDFDFGRGGKLPGLGGGNCPMGGAATAGFTARVAWGPEGQPYLYVYRSLQARGEYYPLYGAFIPGRQHYVRLRYKDRAVVASLDGYRTAPIAVDWNSCNVVLYHVYRGGMAPGWAVDTAGTVTLSGGAM